VNSVNDCINHPGTLEELAHSIDVERRGASIKRFQMAQKKGELRDEVDPKILGEFFAGQVLAISVMGRAGASRKNLDQFIETAMTVIG
ncbi:MAG: hypothetical protein JKY92_03150, partial [Magnetovibrio sp.]|nr:hypothetical protein [Magnetovibrio sp.]